MTMLEWDSAESTNFQAGLDRGVIYLEDKTVVPWSGLTKVEDGTESKFTERFIDGHRYLATVTKGDWEGTLEAFTYPDEFGDCIGISEIADGMYVDGQQAKQFGLSYRTMITTPDIDTRQHYRIHVIYDVVAALKPLTYETLRADGTDPTMLSFDLMAIPQNIAGHYPTAHIVLDSREVDEVVWGTIEGLLYGNGAREPSLPTIVELMDIMAYGSGVTVTYNETNKTWTAKGSNANIKVDKKGWFTIKNVNATYDSSTVYRFDDLSSDEPDFVVLTDSDGVPYYQFLSGDSNLSIDGDTVYLDSGSDSGEIAEDSDGTPYYYEG